MNAYLFVTDDLLKSHYKLITIPGHVRKGKWIDPFQKEVLVADDHNDLTVAAGMGSFYQKQAHKKLAAELDQFHTMHPQDKAAIILHHATVMQAAASASAALSSMKAAMLAGQVPKPAQIKALLAADKETHQKITSQIKAKIGDAKFDELLAAAVGKVHDPKPVAEPEKAGQAQQVVKLPKAPVFAHGNSWNDVVEGATHAFNAGNAENLAGFEFEASASSIGPGQETHAYIKKLQALMPSAAQPSKPAALKTISGANGTASIFASNDGQFNVVLKDDDSGESIGITKYPTMERAESAAYNLAAGKPAGKDPATDFNHPDPWHPSNLKDGDTKVEDGKTYQLRGGKWHLMGNKEANGHAATSKLDSLPWDKLLLADTNSNAKHNNGKINAIKTAAYAGDVAALAAMKFGSNTYAKKQALLAQTAIAALKESGQAAPMQTVAPIIPPLVTAADEAAVAKMQAAKVNPHMSQINSPGKSAMDVIAQSVASKKGHTLSSQKTFHKLAAQDWMAANPDKGSEMYAALAAHKLSHLAALVGPGVVSVGPGVAAASGNPATSLAGKPAYAHLAQADSKGGVQKVESEKVKWLYENPGKEAELNQSLSDLGYASYQVNVPADLSQKPAAFVKKKSIPVMSSWFSNTTNGHNKFWSVSIHGNVMKTSYGKIGTKGQETEKVFASAGAASAAANKLENEKVAKGYKAGPTGTHVYSVDDTSPAAKPAVVTVSGPKEGDTKQGKNGDTLVLHNGHWCKLLTHSMLSQTAVDNLKHEAKLYSSLVPVASSAMDAAKAGDVAGLMAAYQTCMTKIGNGAKLPKTKKLIKLLGEAMGLTAKELASGDPSKFVSMGNVSYVGYGSPAQPAATAKPTAAPAASKPKATVAAPKIKITAGKPPVTVMDDWQQTGPQKGSNPGGKFKDKNGQEWYCKFPADTDVAMNEFLAAKFYEMLGVKVPSLKLVEQGGKPGIASKWVDGIKKGSTDQLAKAPGVHQAFALDGWLANWDVVGLGNDNLMLGKDGAAVRVDVGGSLVYRAQGGAKGADFGDTVPELDTLLDASKNDKSAAVFGGIKSADMAWGLGQLNKMKPSQIEELCQKAGPGTDADKAALAKKLIARRAFILAKMGVRDQWAHVKALDPTKLPVNPADLPKPIDFANLNGPGKGLSSKAHVNAQNTLDSANMIAFAAKGNLTALKNYQYDAVDKESGAALGKKSIVDHPSSQIKAQWAGLIETLQSISTPPMETLKMPSLGAAGSIEEVSQLAGTFDPVDRVETVASEHRMGFFMAVSHIDDIHDLVSRYKWSYLTPVSKFVKDAEASFAKLSSPVKAYISAVQSSGWINHIWSQGKPKVDASGNGGSYSGGVQSLSSKIYADAVEIPEGTTLTRGMIDNTAGKSMTQQLLSSTPGLVIQNTDSMCTSYKEGWSGFNGGVMLTIRCGKGCKATPSFASGNFGSEHEITTLPGQRFVVLSVQKNGNKAHVELFMLPPHEGYVEQLGSLAALGKAIVVFFKRGL